MSNRRSQVWLRTNVQNNFGSKEWISEAENYFNKDEATERYRFGNVDDLFQKIVLWLKPLSGNFVEMAFLPSLILSIRNSLF
jgi:hypothetical protein